MISPKLSRKKDAGESSAIEAKERKIGKRPSSDKTARFVLIIGDDGAILVYVEGLKVVRRLFAPTAAPEHTRAMTDLIQAHPHASISLLMDVIDQQYIKHTFPPVSSFSLDGLVKRRLARDFAPEDILGALRLGRETGQRRDWIYLLVSLANTATFQQWLSLVIEQPNKFTGVYLVPIEAQNYIALLASKIPNRPKPAAAWQLLITHNKIGGFRVVVLQNDKLVFTRVAQAVGEATPDVLAGNIEQEIQNSIDYIRRLGYNESAGLEVFAVAAAEVRDAIDASHVNASAMHLLSPFDVSELLSLQQAALAADRYGDVVLAAAIAIAPKPTLKLQTAYVKKIASLYKIQMGVRVVSGIIAVLMVLLTFKAGYSVFSLNAAVSDITKNMPVQTKTIDILSRQVEGLGKQVNLKSDIATFVNNVKPLEYTPYDAIRDIASMQGGDAKITELQWQRPTSGLDVLPAPAPEAKGPTSILVKLELTGNFFDNETLIAAIEKYKAYLSSAITRYTFEIKDASSTKNAGEKISVALSGVTVESQIALPTALEVVLYGPKVEANGAAMQSNPAAEGVAP